MTGFIRGLFGSKTKTKDQPVEKPAPKPKSAPDPQIASEAYYLGTDDAKTYGNLEYMRQAKTIRRTFPKTVGSPDDKEYIVTVSSMSSQNGTAESLIKQAASFEEAAAKLEQAKTKVDPIAERRRGDSSMDTFRNMARDMRKK